MDWTESLIPISPFIMIIFVVWFASMIKRTHARNRLEMQKELLAKFSSAQELTEFLKTDGGKLLMPEPTSPRTPAARAGVGVLVLIIGIGLLLVSLRPPDPDAARGLQTGGLIVASAGIGLIASAFVTKRLSDKWGAADIPPK